MELLIKELLTIFLQVVGVN